MRLRLTLQDLFAGTFFIAVAMLCLKLSFDKRIAPGSVPNFYLFVAGFAFIVMIPIQFLLVATATWSSASCTSYFIAFCIAVVLVLVALGMAILGGVV